MAYKIPVSVLVVVHTPDLQVLLMERAGHAGFWQSVTGAKDTEDEPLEITAAREVREETGIDVAQHPLSNWGKQNQFEIFERWRYRYAPGVTHNTEHVFSLLVPAPLTIQLAAAEHLQYQWLPWQAAAEKCFSWSNVDAIRELPARMAANAA